MLFSHSLAVLHCRKNWIVLTQFYESTYFCTGKLYPSTLELSTMSGTNLGSFISAIIVISVHVGKWLILNRRSI